MIRDGEGMKEAVSEIDKLERENRSHRFANTLTTAKMMAIAALTREESRGGHFRSDFPVEREEWKHRTFISLEDAEGKIAEITGHAPVEQPA